MAKRRLLFTGGGGAGMEAIWRLWHDKYELFFADADSMAFCPTIPRHRQITIEMPSEREFFDKPDPFLCSLNAARTLHKIDIIIPGVDEELRALRGWSKDWIGDTGAPGAPHYWGLDKHYTTTRLRERGFNPPAQVLKKPRYGRGSHGIEVVEEILTGQEYTVTVCATANSELRAIVPVRVDKKKGITIRGATERRPVVIETCERIHEAFKPRATYNVQGFLTPEGEFRPFEINPRVSTTLCLVIAAGIDPVEIFYDEPTNLQWRDGVELRRTWHNEIIQPPST